MNNEDYLKKHLPKDKLEGGLRRLKLGESPQYIVGNVNFYGYDLKVNKNVLIPRFETEELVEKTINLAKKYNFFNPKILDIGTGSGAIAIALYKNLSKDVTALDVSKEALDVSKENALLNDADIKFVHSDIFSNVDNKFDIIISNPPYIDENDDIEDIVLNNEPKEALFAPNNGLYFYEEIIKNSNKYLNDKFLIVFEIGMTQGRAITELAKKYFPNAKIICEKDLSKKDRFVFILNA